MSPILRLSSLRSCRLSATLGYKSKGRVSATVSAHNACALIIYFAHLSHHLYIGRCGRNWSDHHSDYKLLQTREVTENLMLYNKEMLRVLTTIPLSINCLATPRSGSDLIICQFRIGTRNSAECRFRDDCARIRSVYRLHRSKSLHFRIVDDDDDAPAIRE